MNVTLGEDMNLPYPAWAEMLFLARIYGWEPQGTVQGIEDWDGNYTAPHGQWVTPGDARELSEALDRAVKAYLELRKHDLQTLQKATRYIASAQKDGFHISLPSKKHSADEADDMPY